MAEVNGTIGNTLIEKRLLVIKIPWRKKPTKTTTLPRITATLGGRVLVPVFPKENLYPEVNGTENNETVYGVCAPFPPCNPIGCGSAMVAPIDCEGCSKTATGFTIFGMCILSLLIVIANLLVIRVILRTPALRRRHGHIKLSMATSDLLVGLFVIPSAIANLVTSLYYPHQKDGEELKQKNSTTSVVFGTIAVISVTSSLYNLLLLSLDRLLAIARPLKHRAGRNLTNKPLWISISLVWIFGISLAVVPAFFPAYFAYEMDLTTFIFVQTVEDAGKANGGFSSYYITIIIGSPYFATVLFVVLTAFYTWKSLQVRNRLSSRGKMSKSAMERKCERNKRMKMLQDAYPEAVLDDASSTRKGIFKKSTPRHKETGNDAEKHSWLSWWKSDDVNMSCYNANNNHSSESEVSQGNSQSPRYQRTRDQMQIVRDVVKQPTVKTRKRQRYAKHKTHIRVFRMLIAMVVAFSVCLLPYVIMSVMASNGISSNFTCDNAAVPHVFGFALYMLLINSGMNFVIYNLWHPEFRRELIKMFRRDFSRTTTIRRAAGSLFSASQKTSDCTTQATRSGTNNTSSDM